jgi:DNA-binding transcriptional ArsR family regulator
VNPDAALKALAEPHRRTILTLVADSPRPVGDIAEHLDITPQAVSRHLKVLHESGLVDERREGTRHLFVVNPAGFAAVQEFLAGFWAEHLARFGAVLAEGENAGSGDAGSGDAGSGDAGSGDAPDGLGADRRRSGE